MRFRILLAALAAASVTVLTPGGALAATKLPPGVTLAPLDGGAGYYRHFANAFPTSSTFYPVAVFNQALGYNGRSYDSAELAAYKAVGVNTFANLYNGYNRALIGAIRAKGMYVIGHPPAPAYAGPTTTGYVWFDEADGDDDCGDVPAASVLGETVACSPILGRTPPAVISRVNAALHRRDPTRLIYCQYTKPVAEDSGLTDAQARAYVNAGCNIVSYDSYVISDGWTTNHDVWRQFDDVAHVRSLAGHRLPVMPLIEAGEPFTRGQWSGVTATPSLSVAEAWNAIVAGARGVQWFDHDSGGSSGGYATSGDTLIDPNPVFSKLQSAVAQFDARVRQLAPVLNSPFAKGYVTHTGAMNTMAKYDHSSNTFWVFAIPRSNTAQRVAFSVAGGYTGSVAVQGERRTVRAIGGHFTDEFANAGAMHLYILPGRAQSSKTADRRLHRALRRRQHPGRSKHRKIRRSYLSV